ncbi:MAG TPA: NINE protein [Candidatus Saccharimonadales bacterium]|nr:NINE protein [Candidatus Saccharimonadales bacterium]
MFRIIGADGLQYGPVSAEQLRSWIAAGRANARTMAQIEGSPEWKPLANYPDFSFLTSAPPPAPPLVAPNDYQKSRLVAGLLGIFLGGMGVHRFYLGYIGIGIAQIIVTICTFGVGHFWGLIEGILILTGSTITTDADGYPLKEQ